MKARILWLAVLILLFSMRYSCANSLTEEEALARYNEGVKAQQTGDFVKARSSYQKTLMMLGSARADIIKSVYNNVGVIHGEMGNAQAAESAFQAALSVDAEYKEANFNLGVLYARTGDAEKALFYLTKVFNRTGNFVIQGEKRE